MSHKKALLLVCLITISSLAGCFIEPGQGTSISTNLEFDTTGEMFGVEGEVYLGGGIPSQEAYENISIELYDEDGELMYSEKLGTLRNNSDELTVSISLQNTPYYVIFDSPDIWDGKTGVDYYVRSETDGIVFSSYGTSDRSELPITPDG